MSRALPRAPGHLSRRARVFWRTTVREYDLEPHHLELLRSVCETMDRLDQARESIAADGMSVPGSKGQPRPHPMLTVERDCRIALARLLRELDLDTESAPDVRPPRLTSVHVRGAS